MFLVLSLLLLSGVRGQGTNIREIIACNDCVVTPVLGGGPFSSSELYNRWALAYTLLQPTIRISYTSGTVNAVDNLLIRCKKSYAYDYAAQSYYDNLEHNPKYQDITAIPFFLQSVAMVYNVPGLTVNEPSVNLSRSVMNKIFTQEITTWDHPDIWSLNTNAVAQPLLKGLKITLVLRSDTAGPTQTLLRALNIINVTNWPTADINLTWPSRVLNLSNIVLAKDQFSAASLVLTIPGALGYIPTYLAIDAGLFFAQVQNSGGAFVTPSDSALRAAASSLDINNPDTRNLGPTPDNTSYPLVEITWNLFHKTTKDCETYRTMLKFWHWSLTDTYAVATANALYGYTYLPDNLMAYSLEVLENFQCNGETLLAAQLIDTKLSIVKQLMSCLSGICLMITLCVIATLGYKRKSKVTKAAGLAFALMFLLGCLFNYVSIFFWAVAPVQNILCRARYGFVLLGYTLILGAMFSKSWEMNKVFTSGETGIGNPFQEVPWWQFCRVFFSIVGIQALILLVWMVSDGPTHIIVTIDPIEYSAINQCTVNYPKIWVSLEAVYFSLLLIWGAYLAYETRDVWTKFNYPNESRSILLSIYNLAFCGVILVPLITSLEVAPDTLFFLVAIAIFWPTSFALFSVYMPKLAKFLGSNYRGSNSPKGDSRSASGSISTLKHAPGERGQEQKLLDDEKNLSRHNRDAEGTRPASPESPHPAHLLSAPETPHQIRRGIERTESTEGDAWQSLRASPSGEGQTPDL